MPRHSTRRPFWRASAGALLNGAAAVILAGAAALAMALATSYLLGGPTTARILYVYCVGGAEPFLGLSAAAVLAALAPRVRRRKVLVPIPAARRRSRARQQRNF